MNMPPSLRRLVRSPAQKAVAIADSHRDAREWAQAATAYAQAVELNPSRPAIWVQYGHALKESGDLDRAETAYRQALAQEGANADTHLQLGHLLKISGRPQEAAECYLRSLEITATQPDALREIQDLGLIDVYVPADRLQAVLGRIIVAEGAIAPTAIPPTETSMEALAAALDRLKETIPSAEQGDLAVFADTAARIRAIARETPGDADVPDEGAALIFDASDLIHHFRHSRVPTGIQRVQLEIIASLIRQRREPVRICAMFRHRWVDIPTALFATLVQLSAASSDTGAADWRGATMHLEIVLGSATPLRFPVGACLVNLGTSWHVDYLLQIRNAKRDSQIRYIPFVHDLIPIVASRFVLESVTQDFVGWLLAVFDHADLFLTNSQSTRRDLIAEAGRLGHALAEDNVIVIPLDARFTSPPDDRGTGSAFLRKRGLLGQPFVLMVGTIEPRKNHLAAIDAWAELLAKSDGHATPKLVCVGGRGWLNEDVLHRVAANAALSDHVLFLHDLSDIELAACYDACLFTIYPSFYEGWGLPITESLCHRKVPLLSDASSLPEAGGIFAEYFPIGVQPAFVAALQRLIHNPDHRRMLEARIADNFAPREWDAIAAQIVDTVRTRTAIQGRTVIRTGVPEVRLGAYYPFARNDVSRIEDGLVSGEALRGEGTWHTSESWGCWASGPNVKLAFRAPIDGRIRCFLGVNGLPGRAYGIALAINGNPILKAPIRQSEQKWLSLTLGAAAGEIIEIDVRSDAVQDLRQLTNGADTRLVGPGLVGFYACAADDFASRMSFLEAAAIGILAPGPLEHHAIGSSAATDR
jgi:glycosyltransferase involved in cell wall biosynthesis